VERGDVLKEEAVKIAINAHDIVAETVAHYLRKGGK
jgi:hypothetical protein